MQKYNYHTHTFRCGHGVGIEEEYVKEAIAAGFEVLGFSEHLPFADWVDPKERPPIQDMPIYENTVRELDEKYGEIKIKLGYETEYFKDMDSYIKETAQRVDYLIMGQHSIERSDLYLHDHASDYEVRVMADLVCTGLSTGYFKYLAHPDYFLRGRDNYSYSKECEKAIREIGETAKKMNVPIELNLKGYLLTKTKIGSEEFTIYPNKKVFETLKEIAPKFVIGYDAHSPKFLHNRETEKLMRSEYSQLEIIENPFI